MSDACAIEMFLFFNILIIYLFLFFGNSGGSRPAEVSRTVDGRLLGCSGTDTQSGLNLGVTDVGQVQLAVIVLTSSDFLGIRAETGNVIFTNLENGAERASVFTGIVVHANVIFAAIIGMSVTAESTGSNISIGALESTANLFFLAGSNLISPGTNAGFLAVGQARSALIAASLSVPAAPEDVALGFIGENTVKAGAVRGADGFLDLITISAVNVVNVVAVFAGEFGVGIIESESISADLELSPVVFTFPVLVA